MESERALRDELEALQVRLRALEARAAAGVDSAALAPEYQAVLEGLEARRAALVTRREALAARVTRAETALGQALGQQSESLNRESAEPASAEQLGGTIAGGVLGSLAVALPVLLSDGLSVATETLLAVGVSLASLAVVVRDGVRAGRGDRR